MLDQLANQVRSPNVRAFLTTWILARRDGHKTPLKSDFDPVNCPSALPHLWIYKSVEDDFGCVLAGERISREWQDRIKGKRLRDIVGSGFDTVAERFRFVLERQCIGHGVYYDTDGESIIGERFFASLAADNGRPSYVIGATHYGADSRQMQADPRRRISTTPLAPIQYFDATTGQPLPTRAAPSSWPLQMFTPFQYGSSLVPSRPCKRRHAPYHGSRTRDGKMTGMQQSYRYRNLPHLGVFAINLIGRVTGQDAIAAFMEAFADPNNQPVFNGLIDIREVSEFDVQPGALVTLASMFQANRDRGYKAAHIVNTSYQVGMSNVCIAFSETQGVEEVRQFRKLSEAILWLGTGAQIHEIQHEPEEYFEALIAR